MLCWWVSWTPPPLRLPAFPPPLHTTMFPCIALVMPFSRDTLGMAPVTGGPSPRSRYATPPPPPLPHPLRALRAHLVTKGRLLAIHRVAPQAPENFVPFAGDPRECRVEVGLRRFLTQSISANLHGAPGPLTRDQRRIGQDGALYKCRLLPT